MNKDTGICSRGLRHIRATTPHNSAHRGDHPRMTQTYFQLHEEILSSIWQVSCIHTLLQHAHPLFHGCGSQSFLEPLALPGIQHHHWKLLALDTPIHLQNRSLILMILFRIRLRLSFIGESRKGFMRMESRAPGVDLLLGQCDEVMKIRSTCMLLHRGTRTLRPLSHLRHHSNSRMRSGTKDGTS